MDWIQIIVRFFRFSWVVLTIAYLALLATSAGAQGVSVSPIRVETEVPAGRDIRIPIIMANTTATRLFNVSVEHVELVQSGNGSWGIARSGEDVLPAGHRSNLDWFDTRDRSFSLGPEDTLPVALSANVPRGARGTYVSALLLTSSALGADDEAVRLKFQFLVPLILSIEGRPSVQDVALETLELQMQDVNLLVTADAKAHTHVIATVRNGGENSTRIGGRVRVEKKTVQGWRFVTNAELPERAIIPGAQLALNAPLGRDLPPSTYRLTSNITANGRSLPRRSIDIDFEGSPGVTSVAYDAQIEVSPQVVEMTVPRGAFRVATLTLLNRSDSEIVVNLEPKTPRVLAESAMDGVLGTELSAAGWVRARPAELRLRPGTSRNVRIIAKNPQNAPEHPYFYTMLDAIARYQNGQAAGSTTVPVIVASLPDVARRDMIIERISFAKSDAPTTVLIHVKGINTGNMHVIPNPIMTLVSDDGRLVASVQLQGTRELMIPMASADYTGRLDLDSIPTGTYTLRTVIRTASDNLAVDERIVQVIGAKDGSKSLETGPVD
ncbi:hypothetical protein LCM16_24900 [Mameliella alba]|nr:hypothetical protein [Mameliella alba]